MRIQYFIFVFLLLFSGLPVTSLAQCSDAGVCSLGGSEEPDHTLLFSIGAGVGTSMSDDYSFRGINVGIRAIVSEGLSFQASMPYSSMTGPLGSAGGIGDLIIAGKYIVWTDGEFAASVEAGVKMATGAVNEGDLPQAYQPGLGTTDGLFGLSLNADRWSAAVGYQHSTGRSGNTVNQLRRGSDLSLRAAYVFVDDPYLLRAEMILIQKLERSNGIVPGLGSSFAPFQSDIQDTDRTQINLLADLTYPFSESLRFNVRAAFALLKRPVNIDGLTRGFSAQTGISIPLL
jgi:hypothetical protein